MRVLLDLNVMKVSVISLARHFIYLPVYVDVTNPELNG
jgi:hypothetical protein